MPEQDAVSRHPMQEAALPQDAAALVIAWARQRIPDPPTVAEVIDAYDWALHVMMRQLAELIGPLGVQAVVDRAVQLSARQQQALRAMTPRPGGADLNGFRQMAAPLDAATVEVLLADFIRAILDVLQALIGDALVVSILQSTSVQSREVGRED